MTGKTIHTALLALALPLSLGACATLPAATEPATETASQPVTVGIIGLNDFHGNLQPVSRSLRVDETTQVPVSYTHLTLPTKA